MEPLFTPKPFQRKRFISPVFENLCIAQNKLLTMKNNLETQKIDIKFSFKLRDVINAMNSEVSDETLIDINLTEEENLVEIFEQMEKCKSSESDLSNNHIIFHNNISPNRLHHARM